MGAQGTRLGVAAAAVALVLVGVLSHHWYVASISGFGGDSPSAYFGLRGVTECANNVCVTASYGGLPVAGLGAAFKMFATLAFFGGIVGGILLAVGVVLREFSNVNRLAGAASIILGMVGFTSIAAIVTFPGQSPAIPELKVNMSIGFSFYITLVGALVGAVAGRLRESGGWEGREYIPVRIGDKPAPAPAGVPAHSLTPAPAGSPTPAPAGSPAPAPAGSPTPAPEPAPARALTPAPTRSSDLRFVARSIEVSGVGMTAILEDATQVDLLWSQVGRVIARHLPPDPPYDERLFIDIVPAASGSKPVRILPTTLANWSDLPGGAEVSSQGNLRKLGALIEDHRRGAIEPNSIGFFLENQRAPAFPAPRQLAEYEAQFG